MAKRIFTPKDGKIRNMLVTMGWKIGGVLTFAQGHAVIAKGVCPGCQHKWSKDHRKCVPGLFPGEREQCNHKECGF